MINIPNKGILSNVSYFVTAPCDFVIQTAEKTPSQSKLSHWLLTGKCNPEDIAQNRLSVGVSPETRMNAPDYRDAYVCETNNDDYLVTRRDWPYFGA